MGGFGAIYFAPHLLNCGRHAVACAPQSSVNTRIVPWEPRWMEWRTSLAAGVEGSMRRSLLNPRVSYTAFIGLENRYDIRHLQRSDRA